MGQLLYGLERRHHEKLEHPQGCPLEVLALPASDMCGIKFPAFQQPCEMLHCAVTMFFNEKITYF